MEKLSFKEFWRELSEVERADFAKRCDSTPLYLRNVAAGERTPGFPLCLAIERESGGVVTRQTLRTDAGTVWPELADGPTNLPVSEVVCAE